MLAMALPVLLSALFIHSVFVYASVTDAPIVNLSYGSFQGNTSGELTSFLGIPFAQAPVGKLRFSRPVAPSKIEGIQQATAFGPACFQQQGPGTNNTITNMSEDCLSINVVAPSSIKDGQKLPVLFWIYGGGFEFGATSQFDPTALVQRSIDLGEPVVYVSANYRLNVFGFLSSKEVQEAGVGNLGLVDQRFAMQWVQENIELFGGDPGRVIIWGESAGAISVSFQLLMNDGDTQGLFHGAFLESGSPTAQYDITFGQSFYDQLVSDANCTDSADTLACIREAPLEVVLNFVDNTPSLMTFRAVNLVWQPTIDGNVIMRKPLESLSEGLYAKVPFVSGDCDDEGTIFMLTTLNVTTDQEFLDYIETNNVLGASSSQLSAIAKAYPNIPALGSPFDTGTANELSPQFKRMSAFTGDWQFQAPRRIVLRTLSKTQPVFSFLFRRGKSTPDTGASHASDITEFYGTTTDPDFIGTDSLISFANTLSPGSKNPKSLLSAIDWPLWSSDPAAPPLLTFQDPAPSINITTDTYREEPMNLLIHLWETLF